MDFENKKFPNLKDITGQRFGSLTVKKYLGRSKWLCVCDCGKETEATTSHIRSGHTKSCGCRRVYVTGEVHRKHGETKSRLYCVWQKMRSRCRRTSDKSFDRYGGRGIQVCEEWARSFEAFAKWAHENGYAENLSIDRIDNDKGYSPDNCRWTDSTEQANNRRSNRLITHNGQTKTLAQWAREKGVRPRTIARRLDRWKWTPGDAIDTPPQATYHREKRGLANGYIN